MRSVLWLLIAASLLIYAVVDAATTVPALITYQGRLTSLDGTPINGSKLVNFNLYDKNGTAVWSSGFRAVSFDSGFFYVALGQTPQPALPTGIWAVDSLVTLGITVDVDPEIAPRTRLTTQAYAFEASHAAAAGAVPWSGISGMPPDIADGDQGASYSAGTGLQLSGVTFSIPPGGVTTTELANNTITDSDINPLASINVDKVSGTAMNLSEAQTISGNKTFSGELYCGDSTLHVNNSGLTVGSNLLAPDASSLIDAKRYYNDGSLHYGAHVTLDQDGGGTLYGIRSEVHSNSGGSAYGVRGLAYSDGAVRYGLYGQAGNNSAQTGNSYGVYADGSGGDKAYGIRARAYGAAINYAGYFEGDVNITGTLSKAGGSFKIDHPLDPENKYLQHSFVESPDMMNIYNGNATLDGSGQAIVTLPEWFSALNKDFRYQLTAIGAPGPNLYVASEVVNNRFGIAGGTPGMRVSWQITGVRQDAWANANRIQVEVNKSPNERGKYSHPEVFGNSVEQGVDYEDSQRSADSPDNTSLKH